MGIPIYARAVKVVARPAVTAIMSSVASAKNALRALVVVRSVTSAINRFTTAYASVVFARHI